MTSSGADANHSPEIAHEGTSAVSSSDSAAPGVTIIVPCRNERAHIDEFLRCLRDQETLESGEGWEAIIADGRSDDGTRERLIEAAAADPRVRWIDNPSRTVSAGLNAAIREARAPIIARMDVHTEYAPDYVKECVSALLATGAANAGGPARTKAKGYWQRAIAAAYHSPFSVGGERFHDADYEGELDTVVYGCWRKETLLEIGLFDEELARNQDDELNFRLTLSGRKLWQTPRARSWYRPRASIAALFRQYYQYGYWKTRVIQKHGRPASLRHLGPSVFVAGGALGWIGAVFARPLAWIYFGAWTLYAVLSLIFSAAAARRDWRLFPVLPLIFLAYHAGYGLGFLLGIVDFWLLKRGPRDRMATLTRASGG